MQQTNIPHNILSPNYAKSRIHFKSKKVRFDSNSAIHFYSYGIPDTTKYSQSTTKSCGIPTLDNQTISNLDASFGLNFPFCFGQTQCCRRLSNSRLTSTPNVSVVSLETSYTSIGSSNFNHEYDHISFEVVDGPQCFVQGTCIHPPDPNAFLIYGCQGGHGCSSQTDETILS